MDSGLAQRCLDLERENMMLLTLMPNGGSVGSASSTSRLQLQKRLSTQMSEKASAVGPDNKAEAGYDELKMSILKRLRHDLHLREPTNPVEERAKLSNHFAQVTASKKNEKFDRVKGNIMKLNKLRSEAARPAVPQHCSDESSQDSDNGDTSKVRVPAPLMVSEDELFRAIQNEVM